MDIRVILEPFKKDSKIKNLKKYNYFRDIYNIFFIFDFRKIEKFLVQVIILMKLASNLLIKLIIVFLNPEAIEIPSN